MARDCALLSTLNAACEFGRTRLARSILPAALALLLAACGEQELYSQLSERQANEMVAVLQSSGIPAQKQGQEGRFAVLTDASRFPDAVRALNAQGLPRESFDSMGKVFKKEGFVSSPLEERARLQHAMSQEIANTLASIDGVITARVHLVVPEKHPLMDKVQPAAAAVFIKHRPDRDLAAQTTAIKALVVNSIEGLAYDNVTVALFAAQGLPGEPAARGEPAVPGAAPALTAREWTAGAAEVAGTTGAPGTRANLPLLPLGLGALGGSLALGGGGLLWWRRRSAMPVVQGPGCRPAALAAPAMRDA